MKKNFGTHIFASEDVVNAEEVGTKELVLRQIWSVRVMGQGRPLCVFEMIGGVRPGKDNAVGDGHPGIDVKAAGSSAAVSDAAQPPAWGPFTAKGIKKWREGDAVAAVVAAPAA